MELEGTEQRAVARLSELLRHPDDLNFKVEVIRRKLIKEKRALETQLHADVQRQFDEVKEGLHWLGNSHISVENIQHKIASIDQMCQEGKRWIPYYDRIKKISCTHRNFVATIDFVKEFQTFHEKRQLVASLLDQTEANMETLDVNILRVHYELHQLEELRDRSLHYTVDGNSDVVTSLERMFNHIDALSERFERVLWILAEYVFELVEQLRPDIIVQVLKVVEFEEKRDQQESVLRSKSGVETSHVRWKRETRHYKQHLMDRLVRAIDYRIEVIFGQSPDNPKDPLSASALSPEQVDQALASFGDLTENMVHNLALVRNHIAPCFPPDYNIFPFFVRRFHEAVYKHTQRLLQGPVDGGIILDLLRVSQDYNITVCQSLGIPQEWLEPKLLEGKDEALIQEYLGIVRRKLREWMDNLMVTETQEFTSRSKPPEVDADGLYCLQASVIMFQIVNEQVDLACEANRGRLVLDVVGECQTIFRSTQQQWKQLLNSEYRRQVTHPDDAPAGLVDYIIALANDQLRSAEHTENVLQRACETVNRSHQDRLQADLTAAMDGFLAIAQLCCTTLAQIVYNDVTPVFQQLFTPAWYKEDIMQAVVLTLQDYTSDFRGHLNGFLCDKVIKDLLEWYSITYLDSVHNKNARFTRPASVEKFQSDIQAAEAYFKSCLAPEVVDEWLQPLRQTCALIESSPTLIFLDFYSMKKQYPDLPLSFVKDILQKREDVDKSQVKEIMETLTSKVKNDAGTGSLSRQTIFSKLSNY
ncbi:SNARE-binding exocyst subunit S6 [Dispira simplex]|nr:SNARE-binding exocyst subunit S6 [Dispira simplex]